jgi:replication-associated recombination protein RarA
MTKGNGKKKDFKMVTKRGYDYWEVESALEKAVRRGDGRMAGYWALELCDSGYQGHVWKRLHIMACEDIAEPMTKEIEALKQTHDAVNKDAGNPGRLMVAKAVLLLAAAKKSRDADHLVYVHANNLIPAEDLLADLEAAKDTKEKIPDEAIDQHTLRGKMMERTNVTKWLKWEHAASQPRVLGFYDKEIEALNEETKKAA